jgi:aromatic ring-cleaving dioxygenase
MRALVERVSQDNNLKGIHIHIVFDPEEENDAQDFLRRVTADRTFFLGAVDGPLMKISATMQ